VIIGGAIASRAKDSRDRIATWPVAEQAVLGRVLLEMLRVAHDGIIVSVQLTLRFTRYVAIPFAFLVLAGVSAATFSSNLAAYLWSGSPIHLPTLALAFVGLIGSIIGTVSSYAGIAPRRVTLTVLRGLPSPRAGEIALYVALPFSLHALSGLIRAQPDLIGVVTVVAGAIVIAGLGAVFVQTRPGASPAASPNGVAHDFAATAVPRFAIVSAVCGWLLVAGSLVIFDSAGIPAAGAVRTESEQREVAVTASLTSLVSRLVSGVTASLPGPASVTPEAISQANSVPTTLDEPTDHALATPVPVEVDKPIVDTILTARPAESGKTVTVGLGETLRTIARREYGDEAEWERIYQENKSCIDNPDVLTLGVDLFIPRRE
ncbi:MAG TPA: hypothetical protein VMP10_02740, partial [Chloroflexota bacterium]|nr:hypothetical protein [Chloroflexota bacterium]